MEEIWKDIKGYEGLYQVSNLGRVKVLPRIRRSKSGSVYYSKEKLLKLQKDFDGYYRVGLHKDGNQQDFRINRLVGVMFIPNPNNLPIVHHKDNDKTNNCVNNLEWVSVSQNTKHAVNTNRLVYDNNRLKTISKLGVEKTRKPVKCVNTEKIYFSISECALDIGVNNDALVRHIVRCECIDGQLYTFVNIKDIEWAQSIRHKYEKRSSNVSCKPVRCITTGQIFESRKQAGLKLNIHPDSIYTSIKNNKSVKGYLFEEVE